MNYWLLKGHKIDLEYQCVPKVGCPKIYKIKSNCFEASFSKVDPKAQVRINEVTNDYNLKHRHGLLGLTSTINPPIFSKNFLLHFLLNLDIPQWLGKFFKVMVFKLLENAFASQKNCTHFNRFFLEILDLETIMGNNSGTKILQTMTFEVENLCFQEMTIFVQIKINSLFVPFSSL